MGIATVTLKKGEGRVLKQGAAWIFDNEIASVMGEFQNGDIVLVRDFDGYPMGRGFINTNSKIRVRMLTRNMEQEIDDAFIEMRVRDAWEYRKSVMLSGEDLKACRIIFGDADFLPGMVVDRYEDILVVQALSLGINLLKTRIIKALLSVLENDGINKMLIKKIIIINNKDFKTNIDYYGNIDSYDDLDKICKAFTEVQLDAVNSNVKY